MKAATNNHLKSFYLYLHFTGDNATTAVNRIHLTVFQQDLINFLYLYVPDKFCSDALSEKTAGIVFRNNHSNIQAIF